MENNPLFPRAGRAGILLIAAVLFFSGCSREVASLDDNDFRDPMIRKAQSKMRQGDKDGAVAFLNSAIERKPDLAQAHLTLALLYDDYKKDYVRAIYHYQRYLELRPAAQKRGLIEDLIRKAKISFSASLSEQFPETARKIQALEEENIRLKSSLREVRENLAKRSGAAKTFENQRSKEVLNIVRQRENIGTPQSEAPVPDRQSRATTATSTVYCVQEGDTLSLISARMYHDPKKWKTILDANSTNLVSPDKLKAGQMLVIPE